MATARANKGKGNGPDTMTYVNLGLLMVNEGLCPNDKKYTQEDVKKPTAELVQKIIISALSHIYGSETFTNVPPQELAKFNSHGIGPPQFYDDSVDNIYRHVLKCVPENANMVDYNILLNPCGDLKRTYQLIGYIVAYALFCDRILENFEAVANELTNENQAKIDLCGEIEDIREKCSEVEKKIEMAKLEIPVIEATLQGLKDVVKSVEDETNSVSDQMLQDQLKYEQIERENKKLENMTAQLQKTVLVLEEKVVENPEEFLKEYENRKKDLEMAKTVRSQLSSELDDEAVRDQLIKNVIDMGERCVLTFEDLVNRMIIEEDKVTEVLEIARDIHEADKNIESFRQAINEINNSISKLSQEDAQQSSSHKEKTEQIKLNIQELTRSKEKVVTQLEELKSQISNGRQNCNDFQCQLKDLKAVIKDHEYYFSTTIENIRDANRERFRSIIENFNNSILAYKN